MPKMKWSELSPMQIGRYAEYYAKMEFTSYVFIVKYKCRKLQTKNVGRCNYIL